MTSNLIYTQRRATLAAQLGPGGIAIIPTALEQPRNRDSDFLYRHDSYFYYLTGFTEPKGWLVVTGDGPKGPSTTLFCQPKDLEREIWDGIRLGPDAAPATLAVGAAFSVADIDAHLPKLLDNRSVVWYPFAIHKGLETRVDGWLNALRSRVRYGAMVPEQQRDLCVLLDEMRLIKDASEQDTMRRAAQISAKAHIRAMQLSAKMLREGKDVREFHLDAELLHEFRLQGSQCPAYGSIVAAGANACVLHYIENNKRITDGDLILIDAGCELDGYASDVTRTFPVNGHFSGPQADIYNLVLTAQDAAVATIKPGAGFNDPHDAAVRVLAQGMLDLKLLSGSLDAVLESESYKRFYMHRTSHWLGIDVHDAGEYKDGEAWTALTPGKMLTVEPGCYIRPADDVPEAFWNIGVRIEDDALVTEQGCEFITSGAPKTVADIEALMRDAKQQ